MADDDQWWTEQGRAVGDAHRAEDPERAEQVRRHMVAESTAPTGGFLDEVSRAASGFRASMEAEERGDQAEASRLMEGLAGTAPRAALGVVLMTAARRIADERGYFYDDEWEQMSPHLYAADPTRADDLSEIPRVPRR